MLRDMIDSEENESKFQLIYRMYNNTMRFVAYDISKNERDAEDIVISSLLKVIGILNDIAWEEIETQRVKNLMITITKNTAIDFIRKEENDPFPCEYIEGQPTEKSTEETYIEMDDYRKLISCIDELDDKYRDVLRLRILQGFNSKEVGKLLNISVSNVNMRFMRAKELLDKKLKEHRENEQGFKKEKK